MFGYFGLSLLLHVMTLIFFQRYSLWVSSYGSSDRNSDWLSFVDKKERDEILKTSFEPKEEERQAKETAQFELREEETLSLAFNQPTFSKESDLVHSILFQSPFAFSINEPLIKKTVLPVFTIPTHSSVNLLDHLPKDLIVPIPEKKQPNRFLQSPNTPNLSLIHISEPTRPY